MKHIKTLHPSVSHREKITLLAFLDKEAPPHHSFVDGMLAKLVGREPDILVRLIVSKAGTGRRTEPFRYYESACLPALHPRRRLGRLLNLFKVWFLINYFSKREIRLGRTVVVMIRNDPIMLLAASLTRHKYSYLLFQNSHPHELINPSFIKRFGAVNLFRMSAGKIDGILAVSPIGLQRVRRLFPKARDAAYIPLLAEESAGNTEFLMPEQSVMGSPMRFIYIGSHRKIRSPEIVIAAVVDAVSAGAFATFTFVGGTPHEIQFLRQVPGVTELEEKGILMFRQKVPRSEIPAILSMADIGLCLTPPLPHVKEMSPTKLAEYMGAGVAVLASAGIPLQEEIVRSSGAGIIAEWGIKSISESIQRMCSDRGSVAIMRKQGWEYCREYLRYELYLPIFMQLITRSTAGK